LDAGASGDAELGAVQAVEAAADGLDLGAPENLRVLRREGGAAQETVVSDGGISEEPIPARLGWQPTADGLRRAWQLTIDDSSDVHLWNATVDAETGDLLDRRRLDLQRPHRGTEQPRTHTERHSDRQQRTTGLAGPRRRRLELQGPRSSDREPERR
jgi:hypothetical protein